MNGKQLRAEREAAGAAYVEAVSAFREAWARLAAVDRTLQNQNVAQGEVIRSWHHSSRNGLEAALHAFQHTDFAPRILVADWHDRAVQISGKQIEGYKP